MIRCQLSQEGGKQPDRRKTDPDDRACLPTGGVKGSRAVQVGLLQPGLRWIGVPGIPDQPQRMRLPSHTTAKRFTAGGGGAEKMEMDQDDCNKLRRRRQ